MFIGQANLKEQLIQLVESNKLPQFIILEGKRGIGKREATKWLAGLFKSPVYQPPALKVDNIRDIKEKANKLSQDTIYLLADADGMTTQAENALLKLIEEPPKHAYIVVTVTNVGALLPTIKSRGRVFRFEPYTPNTLKQFTDDPLILKVASNIGEIKQLEELGAEGIFNFAEKVLFNIGTVSTLNSFAISKYIAFKDSDTGHPVNIFITMLITACHRHIIVGHEKREELIKTLRILYEYKPTFSIKGLNKQALWDIMVLDIRQVWRV